MPTKTKIEWCDYVSNPLKARFVTEKYPAIGYHEVTKVGWACVKLSEGCANCWASGFNVRLGTGLAYSAGHLGKVELFLDEAELARLRKFDPRGPFKNGRFRALVFPCDMTDVFGDWVAARDQKKIFDAMGWAGNVDFLVLTKRPERMLEFVAGAAPMGNVTLGVSIENQQRALYRWEPMFELSKRGWRTAVSYEPALGPVNWEPWAFVNWLICGGESGPKARPMAPDWARAALDFAAGSGIPFFFKQWGEWAPVRDLVMRGMGSFRHQPVEMDGGNMVRIGRGVAGHELDGEVWRQTPPQPSLRQEQRSERTNERSSFGEGVI